MLPPRRKATKRTVSFRVVDHAAGERYTYTWYERAKQRLLHSVLPRKSKYSGCTAIATGWLIGLTFPTFGVSAQGFAEPLVAGYDSHMPT